MDRLKNSTVAFLLVALGFAVLGGLLGIYFPEFTRHSINAAGGHIVSFGGAGLFWWGMWVFRERKLYYGWSIEVEFLDGTTERDPVPHHVVKDWLLCQFSDYGFKGWLNLCATLNQSDNACPDVWVSGKEAKTRGALTLSRTNKVIRVSYLKMGPMKERRPNLPPPAAIESNVS